MTVRSIRPLNTRFARESAAIPVPIRHGLNHQLKAVVSLLDDALRTGNFQSIHAAKQDLELIMDNVEAQCSH
jgi:hypothetical protein